MATGSFGSPGMKNAGAPAAADAPARQQPVRRLPAYLEGKLELARVVRSRGLARGAGRAGGWVTELVDGSNVSAIEEIESIGDDVKLEALAQGNPPRKAHIPLEKVGFGEAVPAQVAVAAGSQSREGRDAESAAAVRQTLIGGNEDNARYESRGCSAGRADRGPSL